MPKKNKNGLVLATNNLHKVSEIKAILRKAGLKIPILTLQDFPKRPPVVENRPTIQGNAMKKAREVAAQTGMVALADDTGLFVKALRGKPGVYSARFAGPKCSYMDNCQKVTRMLEGKFKSERKADFRTVAAVAVPKGKVYWVEGKISGLIADQFLGKKGFGYDPVFYVPRYKKTFAQMGPRLKNTISHRARAFSKIPPLIRKALKSYCS